MALRGITLKQKLAMASVGETALLLVTAENGEITQ
jgi:hypothetical protein